MSLRWYLKIGDSPCFLVLKKKLMQTDSNLLGWFQMNIIVKMLNLEKKAKVTIMILIQVDKITHMLILEKK